ncbi:MAG: hypothetical protein ACLFRD_00825 [Nitriliruptoraceae bacterium]
MSTPHRPIVDWSRTARRLRVLLVTIGALVVVAWIVLGLTREDGLALARLAELAGLGLLLAVLGEVVVVGGSAVRGLFEAGERGDRLASSDVSLLPPQLTRRRRHR